MVPGIDKEDLSVDIEDNKLTVKHLLNKEEEEKEFNYIKFGFNKRSFNREFTLSEKIDISKVSASFLNSILTISLPKKKIIKTTKKIKIK